MELAPQHWPNVSISNDGRWLLVDVMEGWTKTELYLKDLSFKDLSLKTQLRRKAGSSASPPAEIFFITVKFWTASSTSPPMKARRASGFLRPLCRA